MSLICACCNKPLELIKSVESEMNGALHQQREYMCSNPQCKHGSSIIHKTSGPLKKQGYITVSMLHHKKSEEVPKNWLRKLFPEKTAPVSIRLQQ